jgi:uracil-DNA glycosylase family 4
MPTPKRELMNYVEFLRESGNLYLENETRLDVARAQTPPAKASVNPPGRAAAEVRKPMNTPGAASARSIATDRAQQGDLIAAAVAAPTLREESPLDETERRRRLDAGKARAEACTACSLCETRNQLVYSDGSIMARVMFVGEAPGADEDRTGIPFVGRAGQLLTKMIEAAGFKREEVYICNTLKCRPPDNRDPLPSEKESCEQFLAEQIETIRPQIIVALGGHSATYLTALQTSIGKLRGKWHQHRGILTMATYHPSFLLRSPSFNKQAWEDLQTLVKK